MKPKTVAALRKQVDACKRRIAKERDTLRDLISELDSIADDCDEAIAGLEEAADAMSRLL